MTCHTCERAVPRHEAGRWIDCTGCNRPTCPECAHYHRIGQVDGYCDDCVARYNLTLNCEIMVKPFGRPPL